MMGHKLGQNRTVDPPCHIMPPRDRQERARIVIETHGIVEARGFGHLLSETQHSFFAVIEPPRRTKSEAGIMPGETRHLPAESRFSQRKKNDRNSALLAQPTQEHPLCSPIL